MRVEEIKAAIEELPGAEFVEIRKWVAERDWQIWDRELETDSKAEGPHELWIEKNEDR
ncbi:MAG: hypothetical protein QG552_3735 [Thermodesulfobacteriota bacterium]|nr:hypothetical protein [Thermodesulfobacteriota bacterium]